MADATVTLMTQWRAAYMSAFCRRLSVALPLSLSDLGRIADRSNSGAIRGVARNCT